MRNFTNLLNLKFCWICWICWACLFFKCAEFAEFADFCGFYWICRILLDLLNLLNLRNYRILWNLRNLGIWFSLRKFANLMNWQTGNLRNVLNLAKSCMCSILIKSHLNDCSLPTLKIPSSGSRKFSRMSMTLIGRGSRPAQMTCMWELKDGILKKHMLSKHWHFASGPPTCFWTALIRRSSCSGVRSNFFQAFWCSWCFSYIEINKRTINTSSFFSNLSGQANKANASTK